MAEEKKVKLTNKTQGVVVAGQIRLNPGQTVEIAESKISEGLKRLIGKGVEKVG
jgi:hypothetical protein